MKPPASGSATQEATRERALELLLLGMSDREVAEELDIERSTVWRWRKDPTFAVRLREANREAQERARDGVKGLVEQALTALSDALSDNDGRVRVAAVKLVLERVDPVGSASDQARELLQAYLIAIVAHLAGDTDPDVFVKTKESLGRFVQQGGPKALPRGFVVKVEDANVPTSK